MLPEIGTLLKSSPVGDLERVRDLEFFEGPLISEFKNQRGDTYLYSWCDADDVVNRWLVYRVSRSDLVRFIHRKISLRQLMRSSQDGFVFVLDYRGGGELRYVRICGLEQLPPNYWPAEDSLLDPGLMPESSNEPSAHEILLDGEWELGEFSNFQRDYKDVYTMLYLLGKRSGRPLHGLGHNIPGGRGWVVRRTYNTLASQIPHQDRPRVESIQYASPGVMSVQSDPETANAIPRALARFLERKGELSNKYYELHGVLTSRSGDDDYVRMLVEDFSGSLGFLDLSAAWPSARSPRQMAHVLFMYYRSVERLLKYQLSGRVEILQQLRGGDV